MWRFVIEFPDGKKYIHVFGDRKKAEKELEWANSRSFYNDCNCYVEKVEGGGREYSEVIFDDFNTKS